jgi:hypothetical protein
VSEPLDMLMWRQLEPVGASRYADVTWPGGEVESVRLPPIDDPCELARARELRIALEA